MPLGLMGKLLLVQRGWKKFKLSLGKVDRISEKQERQ